MTPEEAKKVIVPRLIAKRSGDIVWNDIASAFGALTPAQQNRIVRSLSRNRYDVVGKLLANLVKKAIHDEAEARADAMLTDSSVDLAELGELL